MNTKNLKPFDLEAALRGEPVMLRDGRKAFVRHHETELPVFRHSCLWGAIAHEHGEYTDVIMWSKNGRYIDETVEHSEDIICMYPKTRIINGFEVPAPETTKPDNGTVIFLSMPTHETFYREDRWCSYSIDKIRLERGLVFLDAEDAIANAKAMLGINPYEESEE